PREAGRVVGGPVVAEVVEQEERVGLVRVAESERAPQLDAGALELGSGFDDALHRTDRHDDLPLRVSGRLDGAPPRTGRMRFDARRAGRIPTTKGAARNCASGPLDSARSPALGRAAPDQRSNVTRVVRSRPTMRARTR